MLAQPIRVSSRRFRPETVRHHVPIRAAVVIAAIAACLAAVPAVLAAPPTLLALTHEPARGCECFRIWFGGGAAGQAIDRPAVDDTCYVEVSGTNLGQAATVVTASLGSMPCALVTVPDNTTARCYLPATAWDPATHAYAAPGYVNFTAAANATAPATAALFPLTPPIVPAISGVDPPIYPVTPVMVGAAPETVVVTGIGLDAADLSCFDVIVGAHHRAAYAIYAATGTHFRFDVSAGVGTELAIALGVVGAGNSGGSGSGGGLAVRYKVDAVPPGSVNYTYPEPACGPAGGLADEDAYLSRTHPAHAHRYAECAPLGTMVNASIGSGSGGSGSPTFVSSEVGLVAIRGGLNASAGAYINVDDW